ncbi:MAG: hypothetical protein P9M14_06445 [Candidatus Alcyoniella australis]|nr:hypothetical protein [Candidatus Alcyoniella australis]
MVESQNQPSESKKLKVINRKRLLLYLCAAVLLGLLAYTLLGPGRWWPPEDHPVRIDMAGHFLSPDQLAGLDAYFTREIPNPPLRPIEFGPDQQRVLMLGLKGSDWRLLAPQVREGKLPNMERMLAAGAAGNLRSTLNVVDLSVWVSAMSGLPRPDGHYVDWPGPHIWQMAAQGGKRVAPLAHLSFGGTPFEPDRLIERRIEVPLSGPPEFMQAYQRCYDELIDVQPKDYPILACLSRVLPYDLMAVVFRSVHNAADEALYDWVDFRAPRELRPFGANIVWEMDDEPLTQAQVAFDLRLGEIIDNLDPGTNLLICSSRGFRFDGQHWVEVRFSRIVPDALGIDAAQLQEDELTVRAGLGRVSARIRWTWMPLTWTDVDGRQRRVLVRTKYIALSGTRMASKVWFNSIEDRLAQELGPLSQQVEVMRWGPRTAWIMPREERLLEIIADSRSAERMENPFMVTINAGGQQPGAHGVFLAMGPAIEPGARLRDDAKVEDIAPTILYLLGLPIPRQISGRVLTEVIRPETLAARPPLRVGD